MSISALPRESHDMFNDLGFQKIGYIFGEIKTFRVNARSLCQHSEKIKYGFTQAKLAEAKWKSSSLFMSEKVSFINQVDL